MLLAGNLIDLNLIDGHREIFRGGIFRIVRIRRDLTQVEQQFGAAISGRGKVQFQGSNLFTNDHIERTAECRPFFRLFIPGKDMGIGRFGGLRPDLQLIIRRFQGESRLGKLDVPVSAAGIRDVNHISAVLQAGFSLRGIADLCFPAMIVCDCLCAEVKSFEDDFFAFFLCNGKGGIGFGNIAVIIGDGVYEFIVTRRFRGGLTILESQFRHGFHGNHSRQVAIFRVGGSQASQGIEFSARFHGLIGFTGDCGSFSDRCAKAGCQEQNQRQNQ